MFLNIIWLSVYCMFSCSPWVQKYIKIYKCISFLFFGGRVGRDVCCTLGIKCLLSEYLSVCSAGTISHRKVKVYKKKSVLLHLGLKSVMSMAWKDWMLSLSSEVQTYHISYYLVRNSWCITNLSTFSSIEQLMF